MNPKPLAALNHFTVPFSLIQNLLKKSPIEQEPRRIRRKKKKAAELRSLI
jgi:hypothetical protein